MFQRKLASSCRERSMQHTYEALCCEVTHLRSQLKHQTGLIRKLKPLIGEARQGEADPRPGAGHLWLFIWIEPICAFTRLSVLVSVCVLTCLSVLFHSPLHTLIAICRRFFFFQVTYVFQTSIEFLMKVMVTGNGHVHKCTCTFCMPALSGWSYWSHWGASISRDAFHTRLGDEFIHRIV